MKGRLIRLLIVALSVCIIGVGVIAYRALVAEAAESTEPTPYVYSKNISYSSQVYCYYAIPKATIPAGESPVLKVYYDGVYSYTVEEFSESVIYGTPCYVFSTRGVSPKNINRTEYVVPAVKDGADGEGTSYSILQYLYDKLYREGIVDSIEQDGDDYLRRTLYFDLMDYAEAAQKLLLSSQLAAGLVDPIYGDYNYLSVAFGDYVGFCEDGKEIQLSPTSVRAPYGMKLAGYTIKKYSVHGELLSEENVGVAASVPVDGVVRVIPIFESKDTLPDDGNTATFENGIDQNVSASLSTGTASVVNGENADRSGKVLEIDKTASGSGANVNLSPSIKNPNANVTVLRFDMMMTEWTGKGEIELYFCSSSNEARTNRPILILLNPAHTSDGSSVNYSDYTNGNSNNQGLDIGIDVGEWFTFMVEYYEGPVGEFHYNVYVNGDLKYVSGALYGTNFHGDTAKDPLPAESIDKINVFINSANVGKFYFDNVRFTQEEMAVLEDSYIKNLPENQTKYDESCNVMVVSEFTLEGMVAATEITDAIGRSVTPGVFIGHTGLERTNEILIGDLTAEREISRRAYEELAALDSDSPFTESRWLIYADGGKIAIAYDRNTLTTMQSIETVVSEFIDGYITDRTSITFEKGVIASGTVNLIDLQQIKDDKIVEDAWKLLHDQAIAKLGAEDGETLYEAFRTYYTMFDDRLITWMANLYDPGFGCFYATTSGKNDPYIFPNVEATRQILSYAWSSGMTKDIGSANAFTPLMKYQIIYYVKAIQNPNGYFYLPQLTKAQIDGAIARRGRDLNWCVGLLQEFGASCPYDLPIENSKVHPDGVSADEYWDGLVAEGLVNESDRPVIWSNKATAFSTRSIRSDMGDAVSRVVAVSDVVSVASDGLDYLRSHDAFAAYLASLDIDGEPYSDGNELGESTTQIKSYSKALGACTDESKPYYGKTIAEMLIDFLNGKINEKGLFGTTYLTDNNDYTVGNEFANTNGMMKIMAVYNGLEAPFPADKVPVAIASLLDAVIREDQVSKTNICETYNIWCALSRLKSNVKSYATEDVRLSVQAQINELLASDGPRAVLNAYTKQKAYQKPDGTYAHHIVGLGSVTTHPGDLPVGLGGEEGNVDAMGFGTSSTINMICDSFDLTPVPIYTEADWMIFLDTVMKLEPTGKTVDLAAMNEAAHTEDYEGDTVKSFVTHSVGTSTQNTVNIITHTGKSGNTDNKVMYVNKPEKNVGVSVKYATNKLSTATVMCSEVDVKIASGSSGNIEYWIGTDTSNSSSAHFVYIQLLSDGIYICSNSTGTRIRAAGYDEWFTLSVEYRVSSTDQSGNPNGMRIDVKINGVTKYTETALYSSGLKSVPAVSDMDVARFNIGMSVTGKVYLDNTKAIQRDE